MAADVNPKLPTTRLWARLKGAAFLTVVGVAVVVSMFGWLGGLALAVIDLCEIFFVS